MATVMAIEYVIVGGFGSQIHGAHRQTYDVDLVPKTTTENAGRLAAALREPNARLRVAGMTDEEARQLPVVVDAATIDAFGSTTWSTDAGPLDGGVPGSTGLPHRERRTKSAAADARRTPSAIRERLFECFPLLVAAVHGEIVLATDLAHQRP